MGEDESSKILSNDWKELIVEDAKTKEKLVIINSDGVEITSSDLNVRLVPKARSNPDELKVLAKPLQEYLTSHFNPMCSVVVDVDRVTVVSKELSTPNRLKKYARGIQRRKLYEKRKCHQGKNSEGKGTNGASKCAFNDRWKRTC